MFQLRFHGRGGQGVVTAAELLSIAAFDDGLHAQAFPTFGSERSGAPVVAFCRVSEARIRTREPIAEPDAVVVQDPTLLHQVDVFGGLRPEGYVLVNSSHSPERLGLADVAARLSHPDRLVTVAASEIARAELGRPLPNAALLGGVAALTGVVRLESLQAAIRERFAGAVGEGNANAAAAAFAAVAEHRRESSHA